MRTPHRGAPSARPPTGRAGRTAARTLTAATAVLLALSGTLTASAKDTEISLEVTGDELVLVGGTHTLDITATKTADDPSNPIGCVEIVAPTGWTGLTIVAGTQPATGWSADDGPPATWSADTGGGKLQYLGEAAEVEVSATAPGAPETGTWTVTLYDSVTCADTPIMSAEFDVDVVTSVPDLDVVPASATVTTGATHQVAFTAEWIASDGDEIGCIAVTLPAGWTGIGTTGMGSPGGWSSSTMSQVIVWRADTAGDVIDATGESASFTVTATAPGTAGASDWTAAVFAAIDCSGEPMLTGVAEVTLEAPTVTPEADLALTPAAASVTVGTAHDVDAVATWVAGEGEGIGCVVVTLPTGWTAPGLTDGLPAGWTGTVDGTALTVTWSADTAEDRLSLPDDAASFTVTGTAPGTPGSGTFDGEAFAALDCSGEPFVTDAALVTWVAAPGGGGDDGGDDAPAVLATDPEVLATDPPVPGSIPAGEGPRTPSGPTVALLAGLAAAAAAGAGRLRRRGTADRPEVATG